VKPRRRWYALAAAVAVLGIAIGAALLVWRIQVWTDAFPDLGETFSPDQTVSVDLPADRTVVLYVSPTDPVELSCTGEVAGTPVDFVPPSYTFTFFSGGQSWAATYEITADTAGPATLACTGAPLAELAVGDKPDNGRLLGLMGKGIAISATPVVLGVVGGIVLAVGVARRRRAARLALVGGPPHAGGPPYVGGPPHAGNATQAASPPPP
jgi:hypothetical protein